MSLARYIRTLSLLVLVIAGTALAGCDHSPLGDDLHDARKAVRKGDMASAEKYLERYLRTAENPDKRWEAWKELLEVLNRGKQGQSWLLDCLETMLVEYEDDSEKTRIILTRLGELNENMGRFERAAEYWAQLSEEPGLEAENNAAVQRRLAAINFRLRRFEAAEENLHACLALPVSESIQARCLYDLADGAATRELLDDAERYATQVLEMDEAEAVIKSRAGFIVADIQEQRGRFAEALTTFTSIRDAYPNPKAVDVRIEYLKKKPKK